MGKGTSQARSTWVRSERRASTLASGGRPPRRIASAFRARVRCNVLWTWVLFEGALSRQVLEERCLAA